MLNDPFNMLVIGACCVVAIILLWGIGTFAVGDENRGKQSNKIMRYRIYAQAVAVATIAALVYLRK